MIVFLTGLFIGNLVGFLLFALLVGPRMAELEHTVQGLRQVLANILDPDPDPDPGPDSNLN